MRSLAYLWEFFLLFLGSLTLETRMMYVDVYVCAYSCDGRRASTTDHGTGRGHLRGFLTLHLVFRQSPLFTTACTGRPGLSTSHLAIGTLGLQAHCSVGLLHGFRSVKRSPPLPLPRVCPVSAFPTEPSLQSRGRIFVDKIQQKD